MADSINKKIYLIRNLKVILDEDLASLYQIETGALIRSVKRNISRFPEDFMFQLNEEEASSLRCQIGISKNIRGGRRYLPYAFTEQGIAMLSGIINSEIAIKANIEIMRAFINMRKMIFDNHLLSEKLNKLEVKYDHQFKVVFDAIRKIISPSEPIKKRRIGFGREE